MPEPKIIVRAAPGPADIPVIADGLRAYNTEKVGYDDYKPLAVFVTDPETGKVLGALFGGDYLGQLRVDRCSCPRTTAVIGSAARCFKMAEEEERRRGRSRVTLNTFENPGPRASTRSKATRWPPTATRRASTAI